MSNRGNCQKAQSARPNAATAFEGTPFIVQEPRGFPCVPRSSRSTLRLRAPFRLRPAGRFICQRIMLRLFAPCVSDCRQPRELQQAMFSRANVTHNVHSGSLRSRKVDWRGSRRGFERHVLLFPRVTFAPHLNRDCSKVLSKNKMKIWLTRINPTKARRFARRAAFYP
jgi:hypothetical protein